MCVNAQLTPTKALFAPVQITFAKEYGANEIY